MCDDWVLWRSSRNKTSPHPPFWMCCSIHPVAPSIPNTYATSPTNTTVDTTVGLIAQSRVYRYTRMKRVVRTMDSRRSRSVPCSAFGQCSVWCTWIHLQEQVSPLVCAQSHTNSHVKYGETKKLIKTRCILFSYQTMYNLHPTIKQHDILTLLIKCTS